ncbi:MAG: 30S ribosomal protein S15 [Mycoplasmataceae bacterium]|jgi:small subunit ribosomal protein S15|nr:30S ribosomal protein S15 [Mycoplasmataceae bacterium]
MAISKKEKEEIIKQNGSSAKDTGSVNSQVALLTAEITDLTNHVKVNKKDYATKRSLYRKVSRRRSLLTYLKKNDLDEYRALVKKLGIRLSETI